MTEQFHRRLFPVRIRQQLSWALQCGAMGLLVGSCGALLLALFRLLAVDLDPWLPLLMPPAGLLVGLAVGLLVRRSWREAAVAVDAHYELKDRAATALAFLARGEPSQLHRLQIADALRHLDCVNAREVAPLTFPRALPYALSALVLTGALLLARGHGDSLQAAPMAPLPEALREAAYLEETMLEELEQLAEEQHDEHLEQLIEELRAMVDELKEPGLDHRDAVAKLSEMQSAIDATQAQYNLDAVDAQLRELAESLAPATALESIAQSLQQGDYGKAADELEEFDGSQLSRREANRLAENLKKLAQKMKDSGQGQLSEATSEMAEGIENEDAGQCNSGAGQLARLFRQQALRKSIGECLALQLGRLAECKGNCRGNQSGGESTAKSDSPTESWGRGSTGQALGEEATSLDSQRIREEITGVYGDGPSQTETLQASDAQEQARRGYQERYQEYRRMSEAVLESEPLPLGHRHTIRRYFESIRPQNVDWDLDG